MFEEELKDSKHYQKLVSKINRVLNKNAPAGDDSSEIASLKDSIQAFVGVY